MIDKEYLQNIHTNVELLGLCRPGVRDENLLCSAIDGQLWLENEFDQYCHVAYCINAFHIFVDGNKRTSFLVIKELNTLGFYFDDTKLANLILYLAQFSNTISKDSFIEMVRNCLI